MFERILEQNCQTFDNFNFEFSMSHHNAHYQSYKNAPISGLMVIVFEMMDDNCFCVDDGIFVDDGVCDDNGVLMMDEV